MGYSCPKLVVSPLLSKFLDFSHKAFEEALIESYSESLADNQGVIGRVWLFINSTEFVNRVSTVCSLILITLFWVPNVR